MLEIIRKILKNQMEINELILSILFDRTDPGMPEKMIAIGNRNKENIELMKEYEQQMEEWAISAKKFKDDMREYDEKWNKLKEERRNKRKWLFS